MSRPNPSRTVIVAGAGIGGLTAALALAKNGFRVTILEQATELLETGAGIQLSPNAARVLVSLSLADSIERVAVTPKALLIRSSDGGNLAHMPLGASLSERYGAPYWVVHRGDLQAVLRDAVQANPDIALKLGTSVEDFVIHGHGVTAACRHGMDCADETGIALIAADGLWSRLRRKLGHGSTPEFGRHMAWRALVPADKAAPILRGANVNLWLGPGGHLVHYPVSAGRFINIVTIFADESDALRGGGNDRSWSEPGGREELLGHFAGGSWCDEAWTVLALPNRWQKWALYDLPPLRRWGDGPVTMLGDAAHASLPFLAQGAAMAIEDAAVLADSLARGPDPATAMRGYERARRARTARVQRAARSNGHIYHLDGPQAWARNMVLRWSSTDRMLGRYEWLYNWRPGPALR